MRQADVFHMIATERERQEALVEAGRFTATCASDEITTADKALIVGEEFGEVCGAALQAAGLANDRTDAELKKELTHLAAVTVAWLESLS